jgi:RP/EB family microtubule-associated protein
MANGRKALLDWLNDFLQLDYIKVEQVASGAAHCQIMDAIHPGVVPLHKVDFNATLEYQFVKNFKVLQAVFKAVGNPKVIEVDKLVKARTLDNLEFLQWMKHYFDENYNSSIPYPALERRLKAQQAYAAALLKTGAPQKRTQAAVPVSVVDKENCVNMKNRATITKAAVVAVKPKSSIATTTSIRTKTAPATNTVVTELEAKIRNLTAEVAHLKHIVEGLEGERDFYFGKLRDVEILCQAYDPQRSDITTSEFVKKISNVLYAEEEEIQTTTTTTEIVENDKLDFPTTFDDDDPELIFLNGDTF